MGNKIKYIKIGRIYPSSRLVKAGITAIIGLGVVIMSAFAQAQDKRVTTAILLPIQNQSSAGVSSLASPQYGLQPLAVGNQAVTSSLSASDQSSSSENSSVASGAMVVASPPTSTRSATTTDSSKTEGSKTEGSKTESASKATPKSSAIASTTAKQTATKQTEAKPAGVKVNSSSNGSKTQGPLKSLIPEFTKPVKNIPTLNTAEVYAQTMPAHTGQAFVKEFEDYVEKQIAPYVPGVAVAIISQGQLKSLRTFGVRTSGTRTMVTPDTVFRLASTSKPVAATAVAMYVRNGGLTWDDKVTQVLPEVVFKQANHGSKVTLRHLLSQSVGLPTHSNSSAIDIGINYNEAVRRLRLVNFVCQPGKCYAYQNVTYSLAGDMVAQKAGRAFESVVEDLLFKPLAMHSASFGRESYFNSPNRAAPHIAQGKRWVPTDVTENWYRVAPAAGVNASIVDMSRFILAQLGRRSDVLSKQALDEIQARVTKNTKEQSHYGSREGVSNTAYGFGWRVFDYGRNRNFLHHGGWVKGFRSEIVFNRDLGIGMVFLTNSESRLARDVIFKFMTLHEISQQAAKSR